MAIAPRFVLTNASRAKNTGKEITTISFRSFYTLISNFIDNVTIETQHAFAGIVCLCSACVLLVYSTSLVNRIQLLMVPILTQTALNNSHIGGGPERGCCAQFWHGGPIFDDEQTIQTQSTSNCRKWSCFLFRCTIYMYL